MIFTVNFTTRWADFDPNLHMRHTAYNDYAAEVRLRFFKKMNITITDFFENNIGPILFEENTSFRKEIHLGENIKGTLQLVGLSKKGERWKLRHQIYNEAGLLSAEINVYGAWIDNVKRKITTPPEKFQNLFAPLQKTADFKEILLRSK